MENKKIADELYDYGSITDRDKKVVEEVLKYVDNDLHDDIKEKFEIKTRPVYEVKTHPFYKVCEEMNIPLTLQGFNYSDDKGTQKYPVYAICEDFRKLEKLYTKIVFDVTNEIKTQLKGSDTK